MTEVSAATWLFVQLMRFIALGKSGDLGPLCAQNELSYTAHELFFPFDHLSVQDRDELL